MSAETAMVTALAAAGVSALVSTRVYPDAMPQDDPLPAIVYFRSDTNFITAVTGAVLVTRSQMAIGCYADTRAAAEAVADAAQTALLAAGFIPQTRKGDFDSETNCYIVASLFEHVGT